MDTHDPSPLATVHFDRNRITRGDWDAFAPHRARVTELIATAGGNRGRTLCILGAGNGNDFDLTLLAPRFDQITLVDLDDEALDHCLASQPADVAARIRVFAGVDLSGILDLLDHSHDEPLTPERIDEAIEHARRASTPSGLANYDVVASTCLLTQMIDSVATAIGADHPRFADVSLAVRDGHLKRIVEMTASSGTALLMTDFVSSDTLGELATVPEEQLESLVARAINAGNFFTGVNPAVLLHRLKADSSLDPAGIGLYPPWRWQMGDRIYAVCAVAARKLPVV